MSKGPGLVLPVSPSVDLFLMKPILPLENFLDFSRAACMKNLAAGELEMGKLLGLYAGHLFTFDRSSQEAIDYLRRLSGLSLFDSSYFHGGQRTLQDSAAGP